MFVANTKKPAPERENEFLNQTEAAAWLGFHVNCMVKLSKSPDGPPRSKIGDRVVRYRKSDLIAWMDSWKTRGRKEWAA
jgi:predicted DNA-binding transcriptional regulator AlpA